MSNEKEKYNSFVCKITIKTADHNSARDILATMGIAFGFLSLFVFFRISLQSTCPIEKKKKTKRKREREREKETKKKKKRKRKRNLALEQENPLNFSDEFG